MSRADQGLVAAILFILVVLAGFGGGAAWIGNVQAECKQTMQVRK